ncbi:MAG TPA: Rieske (2Fe-2S) protein [Sphingomonas sp.]|nr:Rieske (2Fe-2S) protein [Sphingomonas sp.]
MVKIPLSEVPEQGARVVTIEGKRVLLCRSAAGIRAIDEICPHQCLSLEGGRVRGSSLICPHHGARFSLEDGRSLSPLTPKPLTLYPVTEEGEELAITIS